MTNEKNGRIVTGAIIAGVAVAFIVGVGGAWTQILANESDIKHNKESSDTHKEQHAGVPVKIGKIETRLDSIEKSQARTEEHVEEILRRLPTPAR